LLQKGANLLRKHDEATIVWPAKLPNGADLEEIPRFGYCLDEGKHVPHIESITLRTARGLVSELADGNAFVKMLRLIVQTEPADYNFLIGQTFSDTRSLETKPV
jgi:hypothetical protein